MINLFSSMVSKAYKPMTATQHSQLRMKSELDDIDIDTIGISERSTVSISVGYTFSDRKRRRRLASGKSYSSERSFSSIYESLVELNNGDPFIDRYFATLFKGRFESVIRRQTRLLLLAKTNKTLSASELAAGFDKVSMDIKKHIQQCLATGRIPLFFSMRSATAARRIKLGLTPLRAFFATGQLIDNLIISYTAEWR